MTKQKNEITRCFIAIQLDEAVQNNLSSMRNHFTEIDGKIRWVKPDAIHITLKFLGDITVSQQRITEEVLSGICSLTVPFTLSVRGIGVFPGKKHPQVLWAGIRDDGCVLTEFVDRIDHALSCEGFKKEKRAFVPHITIARIKWIRENDVFCEKVERLAESSFAELSVSVVSLMKSELRTDGAVYTHLKTCPLKQMNI